MLHARCPVATVALVPRAEHHPAPNLVEPRSPRNLRTMRLPRYRCPERQPSATWLRSSFHASPSTNTGRTDLSSRDLEVITDDHVAGATVGYVMEIAYYVGVST